MGKPVRPRRPRRYWDPSGAPIHRALGMAAPSGAPPRPDLGSSWHARSGTGPASRSGGAWEVLNWPGKPSEGVEVDVWQASPVGLYENQDDTQADMNLRGKFTTDA